MSFWVHIEFGFPLSSLIWVFQQIFLDKKLLVTFRTKKRSFLMSSVEGIDGDISSRYVRDFISETGGEEVLGMDERDVLILNFSFYLATFFLLSIACVVFVIRHKGIPPAFIRSYFHIFIIGFAVCKSS